MTNDFKTLDAIIKSLEEKVEYFESDVQKFVDAANEIDKSVDKLLSKIDERTKVRESKK